MKPDRDPALSLDDARRRIHETIAVIGETERVRLRDGLDRTLACDLIARTDVPAHDNAAMDGYALHGDRAPAGHERLPRTLRIVGVARAGKPHVGPVARDECVRILTGAVMPSDCDAVVMQETVEVDAGRVVVDRSTPTGQHLRRAGEDLRAGSVVVERGRRLTPSDLGLAASIGEGTVEVVRRPRIAVFSTGDELRDVDDALDPGNIRDSNRYTLIGMLTRIGAEVRDLGIVRDDPDALGATLMRACRGDGHHDDAADAIVTSGGVSAGDADYTRDVMGRLGDVAFWKLAVKPGRPMAFGRITAAGRTVPLFGLPGNPVAVMVVFYALVRDALLAMSGVRPSPLPAITATTTEPLAKVAGRAEFLRGIATCRDGAWTVRTTGPQGSGILRSMSDANCLIVLDHDRGPVGIGEPVAVWLFHGLA